MCLHVVGYIQASGSHTAQKGLAAGNELEFFVTEGVSSISSSSSSPYSIRLIKVSGTDLISDLEVSVIFVTGVDESNLGGGGAVFLGADGGGGGGMVLGGGGIMPLDDGWTRAFEGGIDVDERNFGGGRIPVSCGK